MRNLSFWRSSWTSISKKARSFCQSEQGMTLPLLGVTFMLLVGSVGVAVDFGRLQLVQSRLSFALDAAGLAAGSTMSTTNTTTEATKYLQANFPTGYLGASAPTLTVTVSSDNLILTLKATTTIDPAFMQILGAGTQTISATSQITRTASGLELVLVLDNTGSMNSSSKLSSLKTAATTLVNILYGSKTTVDNLWIGLVPFSQAVNIGTGNTGWLNSTTFNYGKTTWAGCVDARLSGYDVTDDPPSVSSFQRYYWPTDSNDTWSTTSTKCGSYNQYTIGSTTCGPNLYCPQPLLFMTPTKATILSSISSMVAAGNTHINLGLVWGWRMLSPKWKSAWASTQYYESEQLPLNYGTTHMNKAVVLLTDGANTMDNTDRTAYWYLSNGRLGTTNASTAVTNLNARMTSVCTAMKAKGIYVYTIALGNPGTSIQTLLKSCATAENYYFNSPSASDLSKVFSAIADSLSNLRISE